VSKTTTRDTGLDSLPLPSNKQQTLRRRGWTAFALLGAVLLLCLAWDARLKRSPFPGYAPDAKWHAYAHDVAATVRDFERTPRGQAVMEELARQLGESSVAFRIAMGIRPTPERWRRWCGPRVLAWGDGADWALCLRPGLLARTADLLAGVDATDGQRTLGAAFYVWHDGFLLVSPSSEYLAECLGRLRVFRPAVLPGASELLVQWGEGAGSDPQPRGHVVCRAGDAEWTLRGRIASRIPRRDMSLPQAVAWPSPPLLDLRNAHPADWRAILEAATGRPFIAWMPASFLETATTVWDAWQLAPALDSLLGNTDACHFAVLDLQTESTLPVPSWAMISRTPSPGTDAFPPPDERIPHAWGEHEGFLWPLLGEAMLLATAASGDAFVVTNPAPTMGPLLDALDGVELRREDPALHLDFARLADKSRALLLQGARLGLLPRRNEQDLDADLLPLLRAMGHLGQLELRFVPEADHVAVSGAFSGTTGVRP
jgi:hypothetical protein